jgi:chaperonin cofactor prefoldin
MYSIYENFGRGLYTLSYLAYLQSELSEKREQLERLRSCRVKLDDLQSEFSHNQKLVKEPELTSVTWKGSLANKFNDIRDDADLAYKDIFTNQLDTSLSTIDHKIENLQAEIQSLQSSIYFEKGRIERERKERTE